MKKSIFISSLLAVCVTCVAQAAVQSTTIGGTTYQYLKVEKGNETFDNLEVNHIKLEAQSNSTVTVNGKTTINSNIPSGSFYACYFAAGTTFKSNSIEFNCLTKYYPNSIEIMGAVQTDSFIVNATEEYPVSINITNGGKLEARGEGEEQPFTIGANTSVKVGNATETAKGSIGLKTVVDGGSLHVNHYASMDGITLKKGEVLINLDNFVADMYAGVPLKEAIDLGDITVEDGILSLDATSITSDVTMNSGELNIIGDVETGALTLDNVTVHFDADATIDLGESDLILGDNVAITLNVASLEDISGVTLFKTTGNVDGLDELTVTFVDAATGAEKKAAVSFNNGSVVTSTIPEPTTATLSLLALCGLAARRRRK